MRTPVGRGGSPQYVELPSCGVEAQDRNGRQGSDFLDALFSCSRRPSEQRVLNRHSGYCPSRWSRTVAQAIAWGLASLDGSGRENCLGKSMARPAAPGQSGDCQGACVRILAAISGLRQLGLLVQFLSVKCAVKHLSNTYVVLFDDSNA